MENSTSDNSKYWVGDEDYDTCTCNQVIHIYIEPGKYIIMTCPKHGQRKIHGSPFRW